MTGSLSKTISITIPGQLEADLQKAANKLGVSRSRYIGNLLLEWQKIKNLRNRITQDYIGFDVTVIFRILQQELPALEKDWHGLPPINKSI